MSYIAKPLRWYICSFINEPSAQKSHFSREVLSELRQFFLKRTVVAQLIPGTRRVCVDFGIPCLNCYHYGINNPCMNHEGEETDMWLPFSYYREHTALELQDRNETWEEYDVRTTEERRIEQEHHDQYIDQVNQSLEEYYRQDRIRMFHRAVERPQDYHGGFLFMLLRKIKKNLHIELRRTVTHVN